MDENDTNAEPMFDDHGFNEGYNIDSLENIGMIEFWNIRDKDICHFHFSDVDITFVFTIDMQGQEKKPMLETRCGCNAMMEIRLDAPGGHWFISYFSDEHNHPLLDPRLTGLLRGHRFMFEADIGHMINMKKG
ncbi:uncharacterized protein LOC107620946 [Arachis ipaensis]|uniref:uncharacterized protein LOC107620946 n=1 Tax=Arachis ipaensis TaxID=130454 RepID=UPI0007AF911D|nr:uncharacterized protein LOC107620946 [Arachis ipaensis]